MNRIEQIKAALSTLNPQKLEIEDDSHKHAGHAGNQGGGHFNLLIVSDAFEGLSLLKRHKLVYEKLDSLMKTEIHAVSLNVKTTNEFKH